MRTWFFARTHALFMSNRDRSEAWNVECLTWPDFRRTGRLVSQLTTLYKLLKSETSKIFWISHEVPNSETQCCITSLLLHHMKVYDGNGDKAPCI